MGRSRLTLKRISNNSIRKSTFMKRREGLKKKVIEYSASRDKAEACLIVYDDDANGDPQPMMTWPEDLSKVHSIIQKYESRKNDEEPPIMFGIQDYFQIKKDLVEAEISKVRKEILKIKYPTWDPRFNNLGDEQLRNFIAVLDTKIEACSQRKNLLKMQHQVEVSLAQTNSAASNSRQASFMQNNFQNQLIPTRMDNRVGSSLDSVQQVNSAYHVDVPLYSTKQSDAVIDSTNQLGEPEWDSLHELVDCARQRGSSEYSTSNLHELLSCDSLPNEFVYLDNFS